MAPSMVNRTESPTRPEVMAQFDRAPSEFVWVGVLVLVEEVRLLLVPLLEFELLLEFAGETAARALMLLQAALALALLSLPGTYGTK